MDEYGFNGISFQDYEDVWQDADDIWHRGPTEGALYGSVFVNPKLVETVELITEALLSGTVRVYSLLTGEIEVKPYE